MTKRAIQTAIKRAGGQNALARVLKCTQGAVFKWTQTGRPGPKYVIPIEDATGVSRHDLRPDIYPREK